MIGHVLRAAGWLAASLALASAAVFACLQLLPGDPARVALGLNADPAALAELRSRHGLDRPAAVRYLEWAGGLPRGDFGTSHVTGLEVGPQIAERAGVTFWLVLGSLAVAVAVALPAGTAAAAARGRPLAGAVAVLSQVGVAVPAFLLGTLLTYALAVRAGWLPATGYTALGEDPGEWARRMVMPWLSLGLVQGAVLTRFTRSAFLRVLGEDYVRTARAKGVGRAGVLLRHGLPNAGVALLTVIGLQIGTLLAGTVVVERVFVVPGLGDLLLRGVSDRDLVLVQGVVVVMVAVVLAVSTLSDLLYKVIDPRLRSAR
ncbi:ABC transporter permease [Nocardiopsis sp. RSe5-2]|uniref:ABC transporter permease n=1 Tax=Nocardiopsis endophytica TaxID=3018445 RepID=A0ABT4UAP2_9ACTN|nr:ABC transporter permease [Nocardiopsis endophytica]MDA2814029.1 ABC transporter permease [Nocardiopsis endophytica]